MEKQPIEYKKALPMAVRYLSAAMRTRKQVRDYLLRKGAMPDVAERVLQKLDEYGYLDDRMYAEAYARTQSERWSRRHIVQAMRAKGLDGELIQETAEELDPEAEYKAAQKAVRRFRWRDDETDERRLVQSLGRQGFSWDVISQVVKEAQQERQGEFFEE